jgi:hypothetical protein
MLRGATQSEHRCCSEQSESAVDETAPAETELEHRHHLRGAPYEIARNTSSVAGRRSGRDALVSGVWRGRPPQERASQAARGRAAVFEFPADIVFDDTGARSE